MKVRPEWRVNRSHRSQPSHIAPLQSRHGSPVQKWPGLAVNPCDVCLIETDGKTAKRLRDQEISRLQSRSFFQKRTCLRWREAQSRKQTMKITYLLAALLL